MRRPEALKARMWTIFFIDPDWPLQENDQLPSLNGFITIIQEFMRGNLSSPTKVLAFKLKFSDAT